MSDAQLMPEFESGVDRSKVDHRNFGCRYHPSCSQSAGGNVSQGGGCTLSYLGRRYADDHFRLMLVGLDHSSHDAATNSERRDCIEEYFGGYKPFNDHYAGVVKIAALALGEVTAACGTECVASRTCGKTRKAASTCCVIECIIQANIVKCVRADKTPNDTSYWKNSKMECNCTNHLAEEIRLAKPRLVVFRGSSDRKPIHVTLQRYGVEAVAIEKDITDNHGPVLFVVPSFACHFLFLYHPSFGWQDRQWQSVAMPAICRLRQMNALPV